MPIVPPESIQIAAEQRAQRFRLLAPLFAIATGVIGIVVMAAWLAAGRIGFLDWPILVLMKFNTAVSLLLAAIALLAAARPRPAKGIVWVAGGAMFALELLTLSQYVFNVNLGIDQLFVMDPGALRFPGRTSPVAATGLASIGLGLLLAAAARISASQLVFFLGAAAPISMLGGYLYNTPRPGTETITSIVAFVVSACMISLCLGGLFLRANTGLMRVVVSQSRAGLMARILMPLAAAVPILAGLLIVAASRSGVMSLTSGSAMLVAFCAIFFTAAVWVTANLLWNAELVQTRAEQALRSTMDRLDAALIANEIGTWDWDIVSDRVQGDKNLAAMFGVSGDVANGGPLSAYLKAIHPEDVGAVVADIEGAVTAGGHFTSEYRLRKADGGERWVLARGQVIRNEHGTAVRMPGVVLDISEQRRAEALLRKSEHRCRMALESTELGMWSVDPATMALDTDPRFRKIFGVEADTIGYEDAVALIHPDDREKVRQAVADSSRALHPLPYDVEYRIVRADGSIRWVHAKGRSNISVGGLGPDTVSFDGTIADVTERKEAEAEREQLLESERTARAAAERASRIKDEFLATLSHEIRTPLSAILGWAQIMRRSKSPEDHAAGLEVIERNARAQAQIIDDLLDMSSIISGKVRLQMQEMDLAALIHVSVETVRPTAEAKDIILDATISPLDTARMIGDANRMQQVLWNLLSNAIKFTPRGGRIKVSLTRSDSQLEIGVADTGEGIGADFLPFVFDRFRQADASTTRHHGGLGLGLSIVRQIAELHGGSVRATSAGPGQGATFFVSLPIAAMREIAESPQITGPVVVKREEEALATVAWNIDGVRVLVVDDEPDARAMIQRLLQEHGAIVSAAGSAGEAMEYLRQGRFDVLLSDIGMPGEDGYSLIRRVRQLSTEKGGSIHAIALTAFARTEDRVRAISAGFTMHLAKPVETVELITMIAAVRRGT